MFTFKLVSPIAAIADYKSLELCKLKPTISSDVSHTIPLDIKKVGIKKTEQKPKHNKGELQNKIYPRYVF